MSDSTLELEDFDSMTQHKQTIRNNLLKQKPRDSVLL